MGCPTALCFLTVLAFAGLASAQDRLLEPADLAARAKAGEDLLGLLTDTDGPGDNLATTVAFAAIAGQGLPPGSMARASLDAALLQANRSAGGAAALAALRLALGDLVDTLTFRPLMQAELPTGFPGFAAVGELELRHYPAYRMVRTAMQGGSNRAFWPLFRHIEDNGIAMTTPVQMDWNAGEAGGGAKPAAMAFLYGDPQITPKNTGDGVEVVAAPAATVLSIGAIGDDRREHVERLRARLETFLAASGGEWTAAGPLRTMGYNSPMVARDRRYFEVQLPVRPRESASDAVIR